MSDEANITPEEEPKAGNLPDRIDTYGRMG